MNEAERELFEIDTQLEIVNKKIAALEEHRYIAKHLTGNRDPFTMEELNELSELNKEKRRLEFAKCDSVYGTHKIERMLLEKKVMYFSLILGRNKDINGNIHCYNRKYSSDEIARIASNVELMQKQIIELENLDKEILTNQGLVEKIGEENVL